MSELQLHLAGAPPGQTALPPAAAGRPARTRVALPARPRDHFWTRGEPLVWASGGALAVVLLAALGMLAVVLRNGLGVFWPAALAEVTLVDGTRLVGLPVQAETNPDNDQRQIQFKTANRELDPSRQDFRWVADDDVLETRYPAELMVLERTNNGDFYGTLREVRAPDLNVPEDVDPAERLALALGQVAAVRATKLRPVAEQIAAAGDRQRRLQRAIARIAYRKQAAAAAADADADALAQLDAQRQSLEARQAEVHDETQRLVGRAGRLETSLRENVAVFHDAQAVPRTIPLADIVRFYQPNAMGLWAKIDHYLAKLWELLSSQPRESNTEGGLLPMIFGTVTLIFLMAAGCFPLGVLAGIYLGEYARDGWLVRLVRVGVNNLAGIPSIVYGVFGLGFFIYGLGRAVDRWCFPEMLAEGTPVFGTGGVLWASLTLGLLTVPVVIVATEEALRVVPRGIREGSYALGATKLQTLLRVLLPMASPGILTGFILAMARAAGEVAPLMLTGVIKLAPVLPLDGRFPYLHLDRQFMHLGFHIFDLAFQSPNAEASRPMVFVATLLLLAIVLSMSGLAIWCRQRMVKRLRLRMM
jgi:phosphate transport system permease protein